MPAPRVADPRLPGTFEMRRERRSRPRSQRGREPAAQPRQNEKDRRGERGEERAGGASGAARSGADGDTLSIRWPSKNGPFKVENGRVAVVIMPITLDS